MNATTLQEMDAIFATIVNITCSKQVNQNVSQNVGIMNKKIENFRVTLNQKEIATVYVSGSLSEVGEALTREELNTEEKTLQLSPKSPFKKQSQERKHSQRSSHQQPLLGNYSGTVVNPFLPNVPF